MCEASAFEKLKVPVFEMRGTGFFEEMETPGFEILNTGFGKIETPFSRLRRLLKS